MNYEKMAEDILLTLRNHTARLIVEDKVGKATLEEALALSVALIASKLKELLLVPEDLESAVRGCFLNLCGQVLYDPDGNLLINESPENESLRDIAIQSLVSAVALLLSERDERIAELEAEKNRDEELHAFLNKPRHPRRHP